MKKANQTTRNDGKCLINDKTITKTIRQELTYSDVEDSIDNIWSELYSTEYLTCRRRLPGKQIELTLPNREVRELFIDLVKEWFEETTQADPARIKRFCTVFPKGDTATIQGMRLPVGFHQCERHGGTQTHEGKLLSQDAAWVLGKPGPLAGKI